MSKRMTRIYYYMPSRAEHQLNCAPKCSGGSQRRASIVSRSGCQECCRTCGTIEIQRGTNWRLRVWPASDVSILSRSHSCRAQTRCQRGIRMHWLETWTWSEGCSRQKTASQTWRCGSTRVAGVQPRSRGLWRAVMATQIRSGSDRWVRLIISIRTTPPLDPVVQTAA
ncbi:hypothetical protein BDW75DRAFT_202973 [Aspergillus navahoensis]